MPQWLFALLFAVTGLVLVFGISYRNSKRQVARTAARRANLTKPDFEAMLAPEISRETAQWLWETVSFYLEGWKPLLKPHPDDDLKDDLPIGEEDWSMDWLLEFAEHHGRDWHDWPEWPENDPPTIRNFGRWLDSGLHGKPN